MPRKILITVLGPTASGKTAFAARLARNLNGEIISADSRQVYRNMDIGSGKDYNDYVVDGKPVPYHLIDIVDAGYQYNIHEFQRDFSRAWEDITSRGKQVILCGGSGMYIESVIKAYELVEVPHDPELRAELENKTDTGLRQMLSSFRKLHNVTDTSSRKRLIRAIEIAKYSGSENAGSQSFPEFDNLIVGLGSERDQRRLRITARLEERLKEGLIDEVKQLLNSGLTPEEVMFYGLEYKYVTLYITGGLSYEQMRDKLNIAIHQFAKRQMTWFRKMERDGIKINWLAADLSFTDKLNKAIEIIKTNTRYGI
ncbi:MAG: tRNA (adenosine(37)-N6)-dimethylallyltransferase MiaA [Bacteroidales bacterium]